MEFRKLINIVESANVKSLDSITDSELENIFGIGNTDLDMVRRIAHMCLRKDGIIDVNDFGDVFADELSGFIAADPSDVKEWRKANNINNNWGANIARGINAIITGEEAEYEDDEDDDEPLPSSGDLSQGWPPR